MAELPKEGDVGDPGIFAVRLDEHLDGAEEWSNEVHWFDELIAYVPEDVEEITGG